MAEQGLRDLPKAAALKLAEIEKVIAGTETKKKSTPANTDDKVFKKIKDHHKQKREDYLFKAKMLQRRLAIMQGSHDQSDAKMKLINGLSKKNQPGKNKFEDHWLEYHDQKSRKKILKAVPRLQMLTLEIEVLLGYAAVHEKIFNNLA